MSELSHGNNHLSVETGSGFSFLLAGNRSTRECVDVEVIAIEANSVNQFSNILQRSQWLHSKPFSISCSSCDQFCTLVPLELFDHTQKEKYLSLNCELKPNDVVWHYTIHSIQCELVFAIDGTLKRDFEKAFPAVVFRHSAALMIDHIQSFINAKPTLYINFYPGLMQLAVMDNRKLRFFNSYTWKTAEDVIYYALFVAEQLKISPQDARITLMGEVNENDTIFNLLNRYFGDVGFCPAVQGVSYSEKMKKHPPHRFINPINQFRCEL